MQFQNKNGVFFELNETDLSAKVTHSPRATGEVLIPRSIIFQKKEYVIRAIGEESFKDNRDITSVNFPEDSELQTIESKAFFGSLIESLTIPSTVTDLKDGWCGYTPKLNNVTISPENPKYVNLNDKIIIGKSNIDSDTYDLLVFARRDIVKLDVPSSIKCICPFCFNDCYNIKSLKFPKDSQLSSIENCAFLYSSIESISLPATLQNLSEGWCNGASKLREFELSSENKIFTTLNKRMIVKKSGKFAHKYDIIVFACRDIQDVSIPPYITKIESYAFSGCRCLRTVDITKCADIKKIEDFTFMFSSIEEFVFPLNINFIGKRAFFGCSQLREVKFALDGQIDRIEEGAFAECPIKQIALPENTNVLEENWCSPSTVVTKIAPDENTNYFIC